MQWPAMCSLQALCSALQLCSRHTQRPDLRCTARLAPWSILSALPEPLTADVPHLQTDQYQLETVLPRGHLPTVPPQLHHWASSEHPAVPPLPHLQTDQYQLESPRPVVTYMSRNFFSRGVLNEPDILR